MNGSPDTTVANISVENIPIRCALELVGSLSTDVLGPAEREIYATFAMGKRKREWLAGRRAAKEAFVSLMEDSSLFLPSVQILKGGSRAPCILLRDREPDDISLSITHSGEIALAAAASGPVGLGIDTEVIEQRADSFERCAFTPRERGCLKACSPDDRGMLSTVMFTRKEAVSKALGTGFSVNTYDIEVPDALAAERRDGCFLRSDDVILYNEAEQRFGMLGGGGIHICSFFIPGDVFPAVIRSRVVQKYAISLCVII